MWNRLKALIIKEFLLIWRDPRSRFVLIVPPIIQLFVFSFAATLEVKNATIGIVNEDRGKQGNELIQRFIGSPVFSHVIFLPTINDITPFIDDEKGNIVLAIDSEFSRMIEARSQGSVLLLLDGRHSNTTQILAGYAAAIINGFAREIGLKKEISIENTELVQRNWFNPNLLYYWYNVPCLVGVLTMVTGLIVSALSVAREREIGTFDQLLVSPMSPLEILLGKAIPAILIGLFEGTIILTVGVMILNVPFTGSLSVLYLSLFTFVCSAVGVGLFISSLCHTQQQAILGGYVFMSPSILLSGFATPIENMPQWLQWFTFLNPLRYILVILKGSFLKALPIEDVFKQLWPIALIAIGNLFAASWFFRRRLE